ncbi:hypothetical protein SBA3_1920031 [Candidatus Sulfopaludibacter sp. SbA3]|nr:hypothetical protein SBA3_1920031 [Candidatus Sulfopaludibacter sp. SbA3]
MREAGNREAYQREAKAYHITKSHEGRVSTTGG